MNQTVSFVCHNCGIYQVDIRPLAENEYEKLTYRIIPESGNRLNDNCIVTYGEINLNPWDYKTFSQIANSNNKYRLELSELNLYFVYKALELATCNSIITEPYEEIMKYIKEIARVNQEEDK